ncbi:lysylphosphatidylglycerol synthase domain-containing protein [Thioalkalivibrio thiocyanodenitrificans]|uniref:lysylphosphatidylglycerol synthase domain-containing protein n=1 Tax=Thioalkalivibrio thiocyanodenitrificans TaxID=243063 RepID=UPI000A01490F|nr:lysylphosphatidylglycerol synthase domain-containing protein [Thioalkalivibrio thiocyanodenitrificans]
MLVSKNSIKKLIQAVFFLVALVFYVTLVWSFREEIPSITVTPSAILVMAGSAVLIVFGTIIGGVIWLLLLRDNGVKRGEVDVIGTFAIAQFGKYLPGNVGQHFGRIILARDIGIPVSIVLNTIVVEMLWSAGTGAGLSLLSVLLYVDASTVSSYIQIGATELAAATLVLLLSPWIGIKFINKLFPELAKRLSGGSSISTPSPRTAIAVGLLYLASFLIMGLILKFQAEWFFGVSGGNVFEITCLFAIAWLAGYLVPGAPGGLGIREAVMAVTLSPVLGTGAAIGLGITLRITTTVGDAISLLVGLLLRRFSQKPALTGR